MDQADNMSKLHTHLVSFFSDKLTDFSLMKPDSIKAIRFINEHFAIDPNDEENIPQVERDEMRDPAVQFLNSVPPIGTPRICRGFQYSVSLDEV